jgi:hypothetical protein
MALSPEVASRIPERLAFVAVDGLDSFRPAIDVLRKLPVDDRELLEKNLATFARDARSLVGYDKLPDPLQAWAIVGPDGDVGLRRALPGGKLELRRWEGRFTLFRRVREGGRAAVAAVLALVFADGAKDLGEPITSEVLVAPEGTIGGVTLYEWRGKIREGRFERLVVVTDGKETSFLLAPPYEGWVPLRSLESAPENLLAAAAERPRPPRVDAIPAPLAMPVGGRYPRRRSRKRRRSGPGSETPR